MNPDNRQRIDVASKSDNIIAFQGLPGAYSDLACRGGVSRPDDAALRQLRGCVRGGARTAMRALAMIPIENSVAGRVADIHHLLPESGLHIIGEHFQRVNHCLLAPKGATLAGLKTVREPRAGALAMPQLHPAARAEAGGARGHRGRGGGRRRAQATRASAPSPRRWRRRSTGSRCWRPTSRMPSTTPRASW